MKRENVEKSFLSKIFLRERRFLSEVRAKSITLTTTPPRHTSKIELHNTAYGLTLGVKSVKERVSVVVILIQHFVAKSTGFATVEL